MSPLNRRVCAVLLVAASACGGRASPGAPPQPGRTNNVGPVLSGGRVYYNDGPAFRDSVRRIIRDPGEWQALWRQVISVQPSPLQAPTIDFANEMVVVVAAGLRAPGDQIRVDSTGRRGNTFVVVVRTTVECQPFPPSIYPHEIVRVPRNNLPAEWVERVQRSPERCR